MKAITILVIGTVATLFYIPLVSVDTIEDEDTLGLEINSEINSKIKFKNSNEFNNELYLKEEINNFAVIPHEVQTPNSLVPHRIRRAGPGLGANFPGFVSSVIMSDDDKKSNVKFLLYNQDNQKLGQALNLKTVVDETMWLRGHSSVWLIHGFMQSGEDEKGVPKAGRTSENIKNAYIETNRTENIVIVSWDKISRNPNYFQAAKDTFFVGEVLADMLISMQKRKFLEYSQVKIVGFSLGAQIAGVAGYFIRIKTGYRLAEITGLDPAGPSFEAHTDLKIRLDKTDADFVQAIHCNMGDLLAVQFNSPRLGSSLDMGHVDFFPNGGSDQPGCEKFDSGITPCSHARCCQLYASSVRGRLYPGCECLGPATFVRGECIVCTGPNMGDMCLKNATGRYFLIAFPNEEDKFKDT